MKKTKLVSLFAAMTLLVGLTYSCAKEDQSSTSADQKQMNLKVAYAGCEKSCITPGSGIYYEKPDQKIVQWGGRNQTDNSKTVDIIYYNTETDFVLKVKSTNGWSDLVINGTKSWTKGPVAPDSWGVYTIALPEGWKKCDDYNFRLQVAGDGPQAVFAVEYKLIGICSVCDESFTYSDNHDGTYTFTYTPSEDLTNQQVVFTFAQSDRVAVTGDVAKWDNNGQTFQKTMNFVKCEPVSWIVGLSPKCSGHSGTSNLWTDFKLGPINGEVVSKKNATTPNITFTCTE